MLLYIPTSLFFLSVLLLLSYISLAASGISAPVSCGHTETQRTGKIPPDKRASWDKLFPCLLILRRSFYPIMIVIINIMSFWRAKIYWTCPLNINLFGVFTLWILFRFSKSQKYSLYSKRVQLFKYSTVPLAVQRLKYFCGLKPQRSKCHVQLKMSGHWRCLIMTSNAMLNLGEFWLEKLFFTVNIIWCSLKIYFWGAKTVDIILFNIII